MSEKIRDLIDEIESLKCKLKDEIESCQDHIAYELKDGRVLFNKSDIRVGKERVVHFFNYILEAPILHIVSAPIIYMMIIPAIILDIMLFVYQQVIFRIYKLKIIKRSDYIVFDRHYLSYLNIIEKINCLYCSYFNGLINYTAEIAAKTELYFCPIKHAKKIAYMPKYYYEYFPYGDGDQYHKRLEEIQKKSQSV